MKKIKEGFINEEIVRRYPGSDNGGNYVVDKGKWGGSRSHDYGKVVADVYPDRLLNNPDFHLIFYKYLSFS